MLTQNINNVNVIRKRARVEKTRETGQKFIDRDLGVLMDKTVISEDNEVVRLLDDEDKKKNKIYSHRVSIKKTITRDEVSEIFKCNSLKPLWDLC